MLATTILVLLAAAAAVCDLVARRVPNPLTATLAVVGLAAAIAAGDPLRAVAGVAVGLVLLLPAFAARWVGGGDVKLLAAFGAWLGPLGAVWTASLGLALGAVLAVALAIAGGVGREVAANLRAAIVTRSVPVAPRRDHLLVPLALPLALAAIAVRLGAL